MTRNELVEKLCEGKNKWWNHKTVTRNLKEHERAECNLLLQVVLDNIDEVVEAKQGAAGYGFSPIDIKPAFRTEPCEKEGT